jgi:hypothetical protein
MLIGQLLSSPRRIDLSAAHSSVIFSGYATLVSILLLMMMRGQLAPYSVIEPNFLLLATFPVFLLSIPLFILLAVKTTGGHFLSPMGGLILWSAYGIILSFLPSEITRWSHLIGATLGGLIILWSIFTFLNFRSHVIGIFTIALTPLLFHAANISSFAFQHPNPLSDLQTSLIPWTPNRVPLDTFFFFSVTRLIQEYGVASTGLHGIEPLSYYVGFQRLIVSLANIFQQDALLVYGWANYGLFIPVGFVIISLLTLQFHQKILGFLTIILVFSAYFVLLAGIFPFSAVLIPFLSNSFGLSLLLVFGLSFTLFSNFGMLLCRDSPTSAIIITCIFVVIGMWLVGTIKVTSVPILYSGLGALFVCFLFQKRYLIAMLVILSLLSGAFVNVVQLHEMIQYTTTDLIEKIPDNIVVPNTKFEQIDHRRSFAGVFIIFVTLALSAATIIIVKKGDRLGYAIAVAISSIFVVLAWILRLYDVYSILYLSGPFLISKTALVLRQLFCLWRFDRQSTLRARVFGGVALVFVAAQTKGFEGQASLYASGAVSSLFGSSISSKERELVREFQLDRYSRYWFPSLWFDGPDRRFNAAGAKYIESRARLLIDNLKHKAKMIQSEGGAPVIFLSKNLRFWSNVDTRATQFWLVGRSGIPLAFGVHQAGVGYGFGDYDVDASARANLSDVACKRWPMTSFLSLEGDILKTCGPLLR